MLNVTQDTELTTELFPLQTAHSLQWSYTLLSKFWWGSPGGVPRRERLTGRQLQRP